MLYAGLDLGTYLFRFVLAKRNLKMLHKFEIIKSDVVVVNFGVMEPQKDITNSALTRLERAVAKFSGYCKNKDVTLRCVATAAMRFSPMSAKIIDDIRKKFNIKIEIISPQEEIYLAALGCHKHIKDKALVIDVGSGSTEIAYVAKNQDKIELLDYISLDLGLINNLVSTQRRKAEFEKLTAFAKKHSNLPVICSKCNTLKIAYNHFHKKNYTHIDGKKFYINHLKDCVINFYTTRNDELKNMPGVGIKRIKLVKLGLPWVYEVLKNINCEEIILCEYGLKEGVVMDLIERNMNASNN